MTRHTGSTARLRLKPCTPEPCAYSSLISAQLPSLPHARCLPPPAHSIERLQGCERSVITYSSLISACEKAGEWKLALQVSTW